MAQASHHSLGKPGVDQIPADVLIEVGRVYAYGELKYGRDNWLEGTKYSEFVGSLLRHIFAWHRRDETDAESGLPHLAHALWCVITLLYYSMYGIGEDDRPAILPLSDAYAAGLLDGEGSIHISRSQGRSGRLQYSLSLSVTNTDWSILHRLWTKFGTGRIDTPPMQGKLGKKQVYVWSVTGKAAASILDQLYPYLRIKKLEALEAIRFCRAQRPTPSDNAPLTDIEQDQRETAYETLRDLKGWQSLRETLR